MAVSKESFGPIEFWSETFARLFRQGGAGEFPPCPESCQCGKWANVRHFALMGFIYIYTYRHFPSFRRESLPALKDFTTNKTQGLKNNFKRGVVKCYSQICYLGILYPDLLRYPPSQLEFHMGEVSKRSYSQPQTFVIFNRPNYKLSQPLNWKTNFHLGVLRPFYSTQNERPSMDSSQVTLGENGKIKAP